MFSPVIKGLAATAALMLLAVGFAVAAPSARQAPAPSERSVSLGEAEKATVRVIVLLYDQDHQYMAASVGSGFVVASGRIITNNHVVEGAPGVAFREIYIIPHRDVGSARVEATIVRTWADADLALLRADDLEAPVLPIASISPGKDGVVHALGYPGVTDRILNRSAEQMLRPSEPTVTGGSIALFSDTAPGGAQIATIFHTAFINPGNSGGPLIDACGRVIGVNTWSGSAVMAENGDLSVPQGQFIASRSSVLIGVLRQAGIAAQVESDACTPPLDPRVQEILDRQQAEINRVETERAAAAAEAAKAKAGQAATTRNLTIIGVVLVIFLGIGIVLSRQRRGGAAPAGADPLSGTVGADNSSVEPAGSALTPPVMIGLSVGAVLVMAAAIGAATLMSGSSSPGAAPDDKGSTPPVAAEDAKQAPETPDRSSAVNGAYNLSCVSRDGGSPIRIAFDTDRACAEGVAPFERVGGDWRQYTLHPQTNQVSRLTLSADLTRYSRAVYQLTPADFTTLRRDRGRRPACTASDNPQTASTLRRIRTLMDARLPADPVRTISWRCQPNAAAAPVSSPVPSPDLSPVNVPDAQAPSSDDPNAPTYGKRRSSGD